MSKTVDDLIMVFEKARAEAAPFPQHHEDGLYAGIAAVIRALRDEMMREFERCDSCSGIEHVEPFFDEILGDAGAEKVAGGPTREDGQSCNSSDGSSPATAPAPVTIKETIAGTVLRMEQGYTGGMNDLSVTPATDPAPAVCVWTKGFETYENRKWWRAGCGWSFYGKPPFVNCRRCGKPIKFTEAKT